VGSAVALRLTRGRHPIGVAASLLAGSAVTLLVGVALLVATGHRVMVDMSDSMQPAVAAGDVLVTEATAARDAKPGDIITFDDPSREGRTVTHRVVSVRERGDKLAFHTKGDANGRGERWTIAADGTAGHVQVVVPKVGYVLAWFRRPPVRFAFLTLAGMMLAGLVLARVWGIGPGRRA
jgi:signal peptidase I